MVAVILSIALVLSLPALSQATTYYVATTGDDTNDGSTGNPWRNPQKCAQPPVAAGDTCIVRDGTYSAIPYVILIATSVSSASGSAGSPITIKSENYGGAKLLQPTRNGQAVAIYVGKPYYIIEGFEVDGSQTTYNSGTSASHAGIGAYTSNVTIRRNYIHHLARTQCSNSAFGNAAVFSTTGVSNVSIEYNLIHTIGRLRNGESGCTTSIFQHDHGIYITWGTDITVKGNICYDSNRGYCMNIYSASTSVHTRYKIVNNTFAGRSPTGTPSGQMIIGGVWVSGEIKNNLFYQPDADLIIQRYNLSASSSENVVSHNRTNLNLPGADFLFGAATPTGFSSTNNTENTAIGFTNALCTQSDGGCENADFTLTAGSAAIGAGTNVGLPCNDGCDQGAFQTFNFASCEVPNGAADTIRVTFTSNAHLLGDTLTTFTAKLNGGANALTGAASKIGDTIVSLPLTTTYGGADTATISWASGGLTDNARIGGTLNQPYVQVLTDQSCTNNAGGVPTHVLTQIRYQFRGVIGSETTTDIRGVDNIASYEVQQGGAFRVRFVVTDGTSNAPDVAFQLRYTRNGGSLTVVPDVYDTDGIAFCGPYYTNLGVINGEPTTAQISAVGGTHIPGAVILNSNAIPTISGLLVGYKTENEYCVSFSSTATGVFTLQLVEQSGTAFTGSYTTPSITVVNPSSSAGLN